MQAAECPRIAAEAFEVLARRRQRLSHAKVRSTTQRIGRTTKPRAWSERFTISTRSGRTSATAVANCGL